MIPGVGQRNPPNRGLLSHYTGRVELLQLNKYDLHSLTQAKHSLVPV